MPESLNALLPDGLFAKMKAEVQKHGRSLGTIVRRAVALYYKSNGPKLEIDTASEIRPRRARGKK